MKNWTGDISDIEWVNPETNIDWIRDLFVNGTISYNIKHDIRFKKAINEWSAKECYENFLYTFMSQLLAYSEELANNNKPVIYSEIMDCDECGKRIILSFDGKEIKDYVFTMSGDITHTLDDLPCVKYSTYSVDIEFPTGELLCADRLPYYKEIKSLVSHPFSINSNYGCFIEAQSYAGINILHTFVGNTSPDVFANDETIIVGNPLYDEEEVEICPIENGVQIASIITDIWWATIVDYRTFKDILSNLGINPSEEKWSEIDGFKATKSIKPGVYRCTYTWDSDIDMYDNDVWVTMNKISDCEGNTNE